MIQMDHQILTYCLFLKKNCHLEDFTVPTDHMMKIKESKNMDKSLNLVRELKDRRNMIMTVMPIVISVLETVPKGMEERLGNWKSEKESRRSRSIVNIRQEYLEKS